jgi:hypothetical protein
MKDDPFTRAALDIVSVMYRLNEEVPDGTTNIDGKLWTVLFEQGFATAIGFAKALRESGCIPIETTFWIDRHTQQRTNGIDILFRKAIDQLVLMEDVLKELRFLQCVNQRHMDHSAPLVHRVHPANRVNNDEAT